MSKTQDAIAALRALPDHMREEVAEMVLELIEAVNPSGSVLTKEQWAIVRERQNDFRPGDASRIDELIARLR